MEILIVTVIEIVVFDACASEEIRLFCRLAVIYVSLRGYFAGAVGCCSGSIWNGCGGV